MLPLEELQTSGPEANDRRCSPGIVLGLGVEVKVDKASDDEFVAPKVCGEDVEGNVLDEGSVEMLLG